MPSRLLKILIPLTVAACATGNDIVPKSEWAALKQARVTHCKDWPMNENDLEIRDIKISRVGGISFIVSALRRSGEPVHYLMPFDGSISLDRQDQKVLAFGKKGVPLGASIVNGTPVAWLAQNDVDGNGSVEVRSLIDNVVMSKAKIPGHMIQEGDAFPEGNGSWLLYKGVRALDDGSLENTGGGAEMLAWSQMTSSGLSFKSIDKAAFKGSPRLAVRGDHALVLWPETNKRDSRFQLKEFGEKGNVLSNSPISLQVKDLEGYAIAAMPNEYLLGYVEGDSLVGNASLQISRFTTTDLGAKVVSSKRFPLANQHVSDPMWIVNKGEAVLLVLTWVDEESTIATFKVSASEVQGPVLSGVFRKGARIGGAFMDAKRNDLYTLMRNREGNTSRWQLCKVDRG